MAELTPHGERQEKRADEVLHGKPVRTTEKDEAQDRGPNATRDKGIAPIDDESERDESDEKAIPKSK